MASCLLCTSYKVSLYRNIKSGTFFNCDTCGVIFRDPETFLGAAAEKSRYDLHKNNVLDPGFQNSVAPIVDEVLGKYSNNAKGLDYGCGNGPVAATLLKKDGYEIKLYDPFYAPNEKLLESQYDFIICNEVIEHFYNPKSEFEKLATLLKPSGSLICQTGIFYETIDFDQWFYKNDPTHVVFYSLASILWIKDTHGFSSVEVCENLITFQK